MGRITYNPPLRSMLISFLNSLSDIAVNAFVHTCKSCNSFIGLGHLGHDSLSADVGVWRRGFTLATSQNGLTLLATRCVTENVDVGLPDVHLPGLRDAFFRFLGDGLLDERPVGVGSFMD